MKRLGSLAVIAGGGSFPRRIAQNVAKNGTDVFVVTLRGHAEPFPGFPGMVAPPEKLGAIFAELHKRGISDLVLIGNMKRPRLVDLRPDFTTLRLMFGVAWALCFGGDDALLRAVRRMLEKQGFALHGAHEFVDGMTAPIGPFSAKTPDVAALDNIRIGIDAARAHGRRDAGQAVVVLNGHVIAREGREGTDALIRANPAPGAVLVKAAKPQQDRSLDLPSIGPETVAGCAASGYAGIAVETGATLVAEREQTTALADAHGLFLIGVK